jgi:hypothetical protein
VTVSYKSHFFTIMVVVLCFRNWSQREGIEQTSEVKSGEMGVGEMSENVRVWMPYKKYSIHKKHYSKFKPGVENVMMMMECQNMDNRVMMTT